MPRDLFGDVQQPSVRVGTRSRYTVPISLACHAAVVLGLAAAAILGPAVLPSPASGELILLASVPVPEPPPVRIAVARPVPAAVANPHAAPVEAPDHIAPEPERLPEPWPSAEPDSGLVPGAGKIEVVAGEPPPPPPAPPAPVRVGPTVKPPAKIVDAAPVYPAIAQAARVEGLVIIEAVIDTSGRVSSARVLRSVPLLDAAAVAAVQQWRYTPTLLNGAPVSVVMTVTVNFRLR